MLLSLALIVKNEARLLPELLRTHRDQVDEILVLDTGSSDGTPKIARNFGARVEYEPWRGDFAIARNAALQRCHGEWILMMDADERLDAPDQHQLRNLVKKQQADAYHLVQRTYTDDAEILGWTPSRGAPMAKGMSGFHDVPLIRLFRRHPQLRFEGLIHETLDASVLRTAARLKSSGLILHHYKERQSSERKTEKDVLYLELSREKVRRFPGDPQACLELAMAAAAVGHLNEAVEVLRPAAASRPQSLRLAEHLGVFLLRAGRLAEVAPSLSAALAQVEAGRGRLLSLIGEAETRSGQHARAVQILEAAVQLEPQSFRSWVNLGVACLGADRLGRAESALTKAADLCPKADLPLLNLALCRKRAGRLEEAEGLFGRAAELNPIRWQTHAHRAGLAFERGAYADAAIFASKACALPDCGADGYLRACAAALALGKDAEARQFAELAAAKDARHAPLAARLAA